LRLAAERTLQQFAAITEFRHLGPTSLRSDPASAGYTIVPHQLAPCWPMTNFSS
jgi:hypothetical protein